jgi:hypothetical protein
VSQARLHPLLRVAVPILSPLVYGVAANDLFPDGQ